jgi:hypothetical protein
MKVSQLKENIRNIVRKKLSEATIDVTNPGTLTSQTKQQLITKAKNSTKNQKIGTADDPVEFIEEETDNTPKKYTVADIDKMSKAELADFTGLNLSPSELRNYSYKQLYGDARELADDKPMEEADYIDDDDTIREDDNDPTFKDYDSVYEVEKMDDFNANVGSGEYELSVKSHPTRPRFLIISQNNGQRVVVDKEDIDSLINILRELA